MVAQAEEEIAKVWRDGVGAAELERARTHLRSSRIQELQSSRARASLLGRFELLDGNPDLINTELDGFLAVTAEQIQAATKRYCDPGKRTALNILPAAPQEAQEG
jgi:predicted Zn-dependent peptidase